METEKRFNFEDFNVGDEVVVKTAGIEGKIKNKYVAGEKVFVELEGSHMAFEFDDLIKKYCPEDASYVVEEEESNVHIYATEHAPLDINMVFAKEQYIEEKDDRDHEFKEQVKADLARYNELAERDYFLVAQEDYFKALSLLNELHNLLQNVRAENELVE